MKIKLSEVDSHLELIPQSQPASGSESKSNSLNNCHLSSSFNESVDNSVEQIFCIEMVVLGSYHQGNHKYCETAGM